MTRDSVTGFVNAFVCYSVHLPLLFFVNVEDAKKCTQRIAATTLRSILRTRSLQETLSEREKIREAIDAQLKDAKEGKEVRLLQQMQRAMAAEEEATREARTKVVGAEGEQKAGRALRKASDIMGGGARALQLQYFPTLTYISAEKNSIIVFPLPMKMLGNFLAAGNTNCKRNKQE